MNAQEAFDRADKTVRDLLIVIASDIPEAKRNYARLELIAALARTRRPTAAMEEEKTHEMVAA